MPLKEEEGVGEPELLTDPDTVIDEQEVGVTDTVEERLGVRDTLEESDAEGQLVAFPLPELHRVGVKVPVLLGVPLALPHPVGLRELTPLDEEVRVVVGDPLGDFEVVIDKEPVGLRVPLTEREGHPEGLKLFAPEVVIDILGVEERDGVEDLHAVAVSQSVVL